MLFQNKRKICALFINIAIVILEVIGFILALSNNGLPILGFYTQESNLFLLISSLIYVIMQLLHKNDQEYYLPRIAAVFRYISICLVAVTFAVVIFVFVPMCIPSGKDAVIKVVFGGGDLYHHFFCPILANISFLLFENDIQPKLREALYATVPTFLYACITTTLNVAKVIKGPYPFLYVYEQPVLLSVFWFFAIPGFGFLFAVIVGKLKKRRAY